jgi:hypothetical protein
LSNKHEAKREVSASELGQIKDKYPQMAQKFEEIKKEVYEPQIERLGETKIEQNQRTQGQ